MDCGGVSSWHGLDMDAGGCLDCDLAWLGDLDTWLGRGVVLRRLGSSIGVRISFGGNVKVRVRQFIKGLFFVSHGIPRTMGCGVVVTSRARDSW